jgi:hypothetical protein
MRKLKSLKVLILLVILLSFHQPLASADTPPVQPCSFYGTVKIDGENISLGTPILAKSDGLLVAETTSIEYEGDSVYTLTIPGDINMEGDLIEFFIDGIKADQTAVWESGKSSELILTGTSPSWSIFLPLVLQ